MYVTRSLQFNLTPGDTSCRLTKQQEAQREEEQRGQHLHDPGRERRRQDQLRRDWRELLKIFKESEYALNPSV